MSNSPHSSPLKDPDSRSCKDAMTAKDLAKLKKTIRAGLTLADLLFPSLRVAFQVLKGIERCEDLNRANCVQHMRIVTRRRPEASTVVHTRQNELDHTFAGESIGTTEQMARGQTPIQAVEAEVLCEPVFELISALRSRASARQVTQ